MEFSINVDKQMLGKIVVTDYTNEYGVYVGENETITASTTEPFKFLETTSLNTIIKVTTKEAILVDVLMLEHSFNSELDTFNPDDFEFVALEDGYYIITHFIIPNELWILNTYPIVRDNYASTNPNLNGVIYYIKADGQLRKFVYNPITLEWPETDEEATVREILEVNLINSPIAYCKIDVFYNGYLRECYFEKSKDILDLQLSQCLDKCTSTNIDTYLRDFLHMTLHILEYLIEYGEFMEALRILELINHCGGFCKNVKHEHLGCGCSTTRKNCGCS